MAFADDLVVMKDKVDVVPEILSDITAFMTARSLALNPRKCLSTSAFTIRGVTTPSEATRFRINGAPIRALKHQETFKYLEMTFDNLGVVKPALSNLELWLSRIRRAPLKPFRKWKLCSIVVIRDHLLPRLINNFQTPRITAAVLRDADRMIRMSTRLCVHVHIHTANAVIHGRTRDDGLGVQSLAELIPRVYLGRLTNASDVDPFTATGFRSPTLAQLVDRLNRMAGAVAPVSVFRSELAISPITAGIENASDDFVSRSWLHHLPTGWTSRDFVRAVQLRSGNLPIAAIPTRHGAERTCRGCGADDETIPHVLQHCPVSHYTGIYRHNEIVLKVARRCRQKR